MNRVRAPFNTNSLAQAAALAALSDDGHVQGSIKVNEEGKKYLYAEMSRMGLDYLPTQANFIWIDLHREARGIYDALLKKGVIVRPMGPTQIRVTVGLPQENERFIKALSEALQGA
jgi:histidinol-phosphate aminotransferase